MRKGMLILALAMVTFASTMTGTASAIYYDNEFFTDRDYLWNPIVGQAPWQGGPYNYKSIPKSPAIRYTYGSEPVAEPRPTVHHVRGAFVDRDLLWNPVMGYAPWLEGPNVIHGRD